MKKLRLATIWLDGCSGCHMSLLDIDERLSELIDKVEIVFSPFVDTRQFPENVDITLVEGAISTTEDLKKIHNIRAKTRILVAFGDCAVTANVPSLRNPHHPEVIIHRVYGESEEEKTHSLSEDLPQLLDHALPLHHVVNVDLFVPGCPPSANTIYYALTELIAGRNPDLTTLSRFGA